MATTGNSVTLAVGTTNTTPANNILSASTAVDRYIRHIYVTNMTGAPATVNCGTGVGAILSTTTADVCFGQSVASNTSSNLVYYGGKGKLLRGSGSANAVFATASAGTTFMMTVVYDEFPAG